MHMLYIGTIATILKFPIWQKKLATMIQSHLSIRDLHEIWTEFGVFKGDFGLSDKGHNFFYSVEGKQVGGLSDVK